MDFFATYGLLVLFGLAVVPRITLLVASFATGGVWWWLGLVFCPHFLVAILALPFFATNPVLVIIAWFFAVGGTSAETKVVSKGRG